MMGVAVVRAKRSPVPPPPVLVVDDDEDALRLAQLALSRLPVEIVTRSGAFGLLNAVAQHRPALVVLDVTMPGLDGTSATELLRQDPELRGTQVLLYSALGDADLARRAAACGADAHLAKTEGPGALTAEVARLLGLL